MVLSYKLSIPNCISKMALGTLKRGKEHNQWSWHLFRCIWGWPATYGIITKPATPPVSGSLSSTAFSVIFLHKTTPIPPRMDGNLVTTRMTWNIFFSKKSQPKPILLATVTFFFVGRGVYRSKSISRVFVRETYRLPLLWNGFLKLRSPGSFSGKNSWNTSPAVEDELSKLLIPRKLSTCPKCSTFNRTSVIKSEKSFGIVEKTYQISSKHICCIHLNPQKLH